MNLVPEVPNVKRGGKETERTEVNPNSGTDKNASDASLLSSQDKNFTELVKRYEEKLSECMPGQNESLKSLIDNVEAAKNAYVKSLEQLKVVRTGDTEYLFKQKQEAYKKAINQFLAKVGQLQPAKTSNPSRKTSARSKPGNGQSKKRRNKR